MDDFSMLAKDFGFRPSGKSAPMKSTGLDRRNKPASNDIFNDVVYPPKFTNNNSKSTPSISDYDYDSLFKDSNNTNNYNSEAKSKPKSNSNMNSTVYDKPLYDDDIFEGLAGLKSKPVSSSSGSVRYDENIFASVTNSPPQQSKKSEQSLQSDQFDDLLGSLGRTDKAESINHSNSDMSSKGLDDLIPGFGSGSPPSIDRRNSDPSSTSTGKTIKKSVEVDDPFVVLESWSTPVASSKGTFADPLEEISKLGKSKRTKSGVSSPSGDVFGDIDSLSGFNKPPPAYVKETNNRKKGRTPSEEGSSVGSARSSVSREPLDESSFGYSESQPQKMPFDDFQESHQTVHDMPSESRNTHRSFDQTTSPSSHTKSMSPKSEERLHYADDIWLTASEIPLFTPVTKAPPPSRPPPPVPTRAKKSERGSFASSVRTFDNDFASSSNSFKYSQNTNASRNKEPVQVDRDEQTLDEEREEEEKEQRRVEQEKMRELEREKARQAVERASREARQRAASEARLKAERAAVQRAQTEARERAAVEARERAERFAAERDAKEKAEKEAHEKAQKESQEKVAVAKAQAEARRRAERAAVERVTAEARERASAEARERAAAEARERAAAEARERAAAEARERAAAEARERDAAEARERAAAEARERAAATKMNQQKNDDDLDSFFGMGSRTSRVPKARTTSNDSATDPLSQDKRRPEEAVRKASSTTNFVDDLNSIFGAATPSGNFQDVEGETEERRRARLERQQRTQERAAKALAEKNQRDQQVLKEQEEKHRFSATLDVEIKRWASGKEGNLRAMLSTLQFVLWPECGWQPISLTDLIVGASVKKAYRKATLCIHPDKVQQKGANLQQKYVAEKVFDLLKEAWNKFNSEELF